MKKPLKLPKFNARPARYPLSEAERRKNEDQEREFWAKLDLTEYYEPSDFVPVSFPNLKFSSRPISIRLPNYLITRVKERANSMDVPYQALIKQFIAAGIDRN